MRLLLFPGGWRGAGTALVLLLICGTGLYVPAALAFPYRRQIGPTKVYSTDPIPDMMAQRIERADLLLAKSPLYRLNLYRTIVLTDGGWRWKVMAAGSSGAIALRRPFSSTLIFNRSDVATDSVSNGAPIGGVRSLSGAIAHESMHVLTANSLGEWRYAQLPQWKREGYADYIAQETSLGENDEALIRAKYPTAPVLSYYEGRRRVAARLARNGHSVTELFNAD